jgi:type IV pilus assembly protein PilA
MKIKRLNRKGFSLIELVAVIAIMAVLSALLVPSFFTSLEGGREDNDKTWGTKMSQTVQMAAQTQKTFFKLQNVFDLTNATEIIITYKMSDEEDTKRIMVYEDLILGDSNIDTINNDDKISVDDDFAKLKQEIEDYINGTIEPYEIQSKYYNGASYKMKVSLTERDYLVKVSSEWVDDLGDPWQGN